MTELELDFMTACHSRQLSSIDLLYKKIQEQQLKSKRFAVFPKGISNSSRFSVFPKL